jgi:hypothetical protein
MQKLHQMRIILTIYIAVMLGGCAIGNGTVNINSPQGQDISVDKTVSTDTEIDVPLMP